MKRPLYDLVDKGSGICSPERFISAKQRETTLRTPDNAFSGDESSQLRLGNSAHVATYSLSSSDHDTRYVY
jgi:hypothetical protein